MSIDAMNGSDDLGETTLYVYTETAASQATEETDETIENLKKNFFSREHKPNRFHKEVTRECPATAHKAHAFVTKTCKAMGYDPVLASGIGVDWNLSFDNNGKVSTGMTVNAHDDHGNEGHVRGEITRDPEGNYSGNISAGGSQDTEKDKDKDKQK